MKLSVRFKFFTGLLMSCCFRSYVNVIPFILYGCMLSSGGGYMVRDRDELGGVGSVGDASKIGSFMC